MGHGRNDHPDFAEKSGKIRAADCLQGRYGHRKEAETYPQRMVLKKVGIHGKARKREIAADAA